MPQRAETPLSLLDRVQRGDQVAWNEFSGMYMGVLRGWCVRWGLQPADADDLTQDTLLVVLTEIRRFRHRGTGSFRSWMRTVAWHCLCTAITRAEKKQVAETFNQILLSAQARRTLEEEIDRLCEMQILSEVMNSVEMKVKPTTWTAFRMTAIDGLSAREVSECTGLNAEAIYAARARVQRLISQELRRITGPVD